MSDAPDDTEDDRPIYWPRVRFGSADAPAVDWQSAPFDDTDDDEEPDETPSDVIQMLGLDPRDLIEEGGDPEEADPAGDKAEEGEVDDGFDIEADPFAPRDDDKDDED